jgi:ribosomal protein L11 methylase PrmA
MEVIFKTLITIGIILLGGLLTIFLPWAFGAPFQPSNKRQIKRILELAEVRQGEKALDLGSGSGDVVIALAKAGAEAHGYEINPILAWISRKRIKAFGLEGKAIIHNANFWDADFSKFDLITSFQVSYVMGKLAKKIRAECKKTVKIVSNTWIFPNWKPERKIEEVYLYKI